MTDLTTRVTVLETQVKALEKYTGALQTIVLALANAERKAIAAEAGPEGEYNPDDEGHPENVHEYMRQLRRY
jgi:hypothetical protein